MPCHDVSLAGSDVFYGSNASLALARRCINSGGCVDGGCCFEEINFVGASRSAAGDSSRKSSHCEKTVRVGCLSRRRGDNAGAVPDAAAERPPRLWHSWVRRACLQTYSTAGDASVDASIYYLSLFSFSFLLHFE